MSIDYDKEFVKILDDIKCMSNQIKDSIRNGDKPSIKGKKNLIILEVRKLMKCLREINDKR